MKYTYSRLLAVFLFLLPVSAFSQITISPADTFEVCPGECQLLTATVPQGAGITFLQVDDVYSSVIPIGFTFNFYGTNYTSCVISSNGYLSFNTSQAGGYSAWTITQGVPGNPNVLNSIMGFYSDIYPSTSPGTGILQYATVGTAPNRRFVVSFCDVRMYSCTNLKASFQIILHESTNLIDLSIANAPNCPSWNSGAGIQGVQNATGSAGTTTPGRNYPTIWTAQQDTWRYTPGGGGSSYTAAQIGYYIVPISTPDIYWYENGTTYLGAGSTITVCPTQATSYTAAAVSCSDTVRDTVYAVIGGGPDLTGITGTDPTTCGGSDGTITISGMPPNMAYTLHYDYNGSPQTPIAVTSNLYGEVTLTGLSEGTYDNFVMYAGTCSSNTVGPVELVSPPLTADFDFQINWGCSADTVLFTNLSQIAGPVSYNWTFGDSGNSDTNVNPVHVYQTQGNFTVTLIATNGVCADTVTKQVQLNHPLNAFFQVQTDSVCLGTPITFMNGTAVSTEHGLPSYHWDFGDGTTEDVVVSPTHTYSAPGVYHVTLTVTDFVPCVDSYSITIVVDSIADLSFTTSDDVLCEGQSVTFIGSLADDQLTGYQWNFGDGTIISNLNPIDHAFDMPGQYTINLSATYRICPENSFSQQLTVLPFPKVNLGRDTSMCPGEGPFPLYDYQNAGNPDAYWTWSTGDSGTVPGIVALAPGTYWTEVSIKGCTAADTVEITNDCYLGQPNVFTPDGDGLNDYWLPRQLVGKSVTSFSLNIYNRWGQLVYQTAKTDGRGWDGKMNNGQPQPQGVYVWQMDVLFRDGRRETMTGNVTLLR